MKNGLKERNAILVIYPQKNKIKKAFGQFPTKRHCSIVTTRFLKDQLENTLQHWNNSIITNLHKRTPNSPKADVLYKEDRSDISASKLPIQDVHIISDCDLVEISIDYSILPPFDPVTPLWQSNMCKDLNLNMVNGIGYISNI